MNKKKPQILQIIQILIILGFVFNLLGLLFSFSTPISSLLEISQTLYIVLGLITLLFYILLLLGIQKATIQGYKIIRFTLIAYIVYELVFLILLLSLTELGLVSITSSIIMVPFLFLGLWYFKQIKGYFSSGYLDSEEEKSINEIFMKYFVILIVIIFVISLAGILFYSMSNLTTNLKYYSILNNQSARDNLEYCRQQPSPQKQDECLDFLLRWYQAEGKLRASLDESVCDYFNDNGKKEQCKLAFK
jgi:hypothetical protein